MNIHTSVLQRVLTTGSVSMYAHVYLISTLYCGHMIYDDLNVVISGTIVSYTTLKLAYQLGLYMIEQYVHSVFRYICTDKTKLDLKATGVV